MLHSRLEIPRHLKRKFLQGHMNDILGPMRNDQRITGVLVKIDNDNIALFRRL
jgi:hypothetical protein